MRSSLSSALIVLCDAIGHASTLDEICEAAIDGVARATGIARTSILLFDARGVMRFRAWHGLSDAYRAAVEGHSPWSAGSPPPDPIVIADAAREPSLVSLRAAIEREGITALAFVPIVSRRQVIGKFMLYRDEPYAFDAGEVPAALAMGYQIGFAVERVQSLNDEAAFRERLSVLTDASQRLLTSLDPGSVVHEILSLARKVIAADAYAVWRREGRAWRCGASRNLSAAFVNEELADGERFRIEAPFVAEDVGRSPLPEARRRAFLEEGIESLAAIPVVEDTAIQAFITFYYRARHRPSEVDLQVAAALGRLAAVAMRNARLFSDAQVANRVKDEFLAALSHELRTPLNVILGRTRMLGAVNEPAARSHAEIIDRNARVLARLVEDLLDVSRITAGRIDLELQPLQIATVIEAAVAAVEHAARAKSLALAVETAGTLPALLGDATRLQQILSNLLGNAIRFTPPGGAVRVAARADGGEVVLTVADTGVGIAPEFLPHVFEMFRQAEPSTTRRFGGLGLGLSIVRRLAQLHGGTVTVESDGPDKGTTFTVRLPASASVALVPSQAEKQSVAGLDIR